MTANPFFPLSNQELAEEYALSHSMQWGGEEHGLLIEEIKARGLSLDDLEGMTTGTHN